MPCFKGIAVSIHANSAPLPEHGMQKQSRFSRISSYIPVPQPQIVGDTNKAEPAKFAISITLLTPGLPVPYSTPKATESNPYPKPQFVGSHDQKAGQGVVCPYQSVTKSENETIAAYIYFDGRAKEEVATLLRPGEETWVNSRWVQVPDSEGGGLAEREFLFKEVGLERWLNGLDLKGHDAAEKLEKRRQKFEKRQRRRIANMTDNEGMDVEAGSSNARSTLRYGSDDKSPLETVMDDSDSSDDDDDEPPEATGQIKVSMFRVLASGEIKKGEYSPQFDAHDGDDDYDGKDSGGLDADVEHTTSFAKPKSLDPKTISTQTVTGIDGPDQPYATFTFFYRGERQLQKNGIIPSAKNSQPTPAADKRRSGQLDFTKLGPLKAGGTVGFTAFREQQPDATQRKRTRAKSNGKMTEDSDDDDEEDDTVLGRMEDADDKYDSSRLGPEDARSQGELADGVNRIRLKRAHSADPEGAPTPETTQRPSGTTESSSTTRGNSAEPSAIGRSSSTQSTGDVPAEALVGSPLKKPRPSISQSNIADGTYSATQSLSAALDAVVSGGKPAANPSGQDINKTTTEKEEEL